MSEEERLHKMECIIMAMNAGLQQISPATKSVPESRSSVAAKWNAILHDIEATWLEAWGPQVPDLLPWHESGARYHRGMADAWRHIENDRLSADLREEG